MEEDAVKLKDSLKVQDSAKIQMPSKDVEVAPQKEEPNRKDGVDTSKGSPEAQGSAVMETPKKAVSKDAEVIRPLKVVAEIQETADGMVHRQGQIFNKLVAEHKAPSGNGVGIAGLASGFLLSSGRISASKGKSCAASVSTEVSPQESQTQHEQLHESKPAHPEQLSQEKLTSRSQSCDSLAMSVPPSTTASDEQSDSQPLSSSSTSTIEGTKAEQKDSLGFSPVGKKVASSRQSAKSIDVAISDEAPLSGNHSVTEGISDPVSPSRQERERFRLMLFGAPQHDDISGNSEKCDPASTKSVGQTEAHQQEQVHESEPSADADEALSGKTTLPMDEGLDSEDGGFALYSLPAAIGLTWMIVLTTLAGSIYFRQDCTFCMASISLTLISTITWSFHDTGKPRREDSHT
jgi:hypothetical protein